jgi:hypothetical protein
MAGTQGKGEKGSNEKKTGGVATLKNSARRAQKHAKLVGKQQERSAERLEMLTKVIDKFKGVRLPDLRKRFGTLNIRRMTDILSDNWETSEWYVARVARRLALKERAKAVRKHVRFRKRTKAEKKALHQSQQRTPIQDVSE